MVLGIVGCPLLLQVWSWARFPIGRPEIRDGSWPPDELYDAERIDMPTFGSLWTSRKGHFGHNQLRNCYPAFTEQFDLLLESDVTWEPYSEDHRDEAYPGGISNMCTRDWAYWMTKAKIIFDIFVEEMSQQRVMRQFGQRQLIEPPPPTVPLPPRVHAYNRKGANKTAAGWLQLLAPYITGWANAPAVSWATMGPFDLQEFEHYLRAYMPRTRLRLSQVCDPVQRDPSTMWDTYPRHSTSGTRHHAAVLTAELQDDAAQYARSLSSGPLLGRYEHHASFAQRLQDKLRRIYATITCTRSSDVAEYRAAQRPPRPSLQVHQPRHAPRPRMEVPPSPRPPSPNQAGGSGWQNQQQQEPTYEYWQRAGFGMEQQFPMPNFGWRPRMDEPEGEGHMSTGSGSRSFWSKVLTIGTKHSRAIKTGFQVNSKLHLRIPRDTVKTSRGTCFLPDIASHLFVSFFAFVLGSKSSSESMTGGAALFPFEDLALLPFDDAAFFALLLGSKISSSSSLSTVHSPWKVEISFPISFILPS
ncbi:uncharacterized protein [Lolium perenne]|uniref:uncharacterized protein n=1 Tax=Lolium perenne TaxID=4522 RepID=UPI003A9A2EB6